MVIRKKLAAQIMAAHLENVQKGVTLLFTTLLEDDKSYIFNYESVHSRTKYATLSILI